MEDQMSEDRRNASRLPDESEDPARGTPSFHGGSGAGVPTPKERDRVGGSGPGPERDPDEPELGIRPEDQANAAGGGYGSASGRSSGGTGDGEAGSPLVGSAMDDGTSSGATGATDAGPTEWLRDAEGGPREASDAGPTVGEDGPGIAGAPVGDDNIREGRVRGVMGVSHPSAGQGQGG
jgi:hypothetical protein